jgi:hypothetical protein
LELAFVWLGALLVVVRWVRCSATAGGGPETVAGAFAGRSP